jgi:hypothetical protein
MAGVNGSPVNAAKARVQDGLTVAGLTGTPTITVTAGDIGDPVVVTTSIAFPKIIGLVPVPATITSSATMLMDH